MLAHELDEPLGTFSPVLRETFKILKRRRDAALAEQLHGVFCVLVEVGVEDALVLEIQILADVEQLPLALRHFSTRHAKYGAGDQLRVVEHGNMSDIGQDFKCRSGQTLA